MLEVRNLQVKVKNNAKIILNNFNLKIEAGQTHVIMGPNGTGKSTLAKVIMGHYQYEVVAGDILFQGQSILKASVDERARLGIFLCMQDPTIIEGVSNSEFLRTSLGEVTGEHVSLYQFMKDLDKSVQEVGLSSDMLHRSLNSGFSGGEKKKNEILQLKILKPKFIILDELDSGLDVDSLKIVCKNINKYIKANPNTSLLIITHYPKILEYLKPTYVHMMKDGKIVETGDISLAKKIEKTGYNTMNGNDTFE